jgi:hypothetical protein
MLALTLILAGDPGDVLPAMKEQSQAAREYYTESPAVKPVQSLALPAKIQSHWLVAVVEHLAALRR